MIHAETILSSLPIRSERGGCAADRLQNEAAPFEAVLQEVVCRPPPQPCAVALPIPAGANFWSLPVAERQRLVRAFDAYLRALPQVLADGQAGRFAVFHAGQAVSIWDTQADALQAAYACFGLASFSVQRIDPCDVEHFAQLEAQAAATCQA